MSLFVDGRQSLSQRSASATSDVIVRRSPSSPHRASGDVNCPEPPSDVMWRRLQNIGTSGRTGSRISLMPSPFPADDIDGIIIVDGDDDVSLMTPHPVRHDRKRPRTTTPASHHANRTDQARAGVGNRADSQSYDTGNRAFSDFLRKLNSSARSHSHRRHSNATGDNVVVRRRHSRHVTDDDATAGDAASSGGGGLPGRTSWHCSVEKYWKKMSPDVYPQYVQTGRCLSSTCMFGLYECRPVKYAVNVLKRYSSVDNRKRCVPVPSSSSADTAYEQAWVMSHVQVTVACQCSRKRAPNSS